MSDANKNDQSPVVLEAEITKPSSSNRGIWLFSIFQFLCLITISAGSGWHYWQWKKQENNQQSNAAALQQSFDSLTSSVDKSLNQITEYQSNTQTAIASMLEKQQANDEALSFTQQKLNDLAGRRPADWLLAEADYLVKMAGRKLWLEDDVGTAVMLLSAADARLQDLADPSLFPVRKHIASDIQNLQSLNKVAPTSIALALNGMREQIVNLPVNAVVLPEPVEPELDTELSEDPRDWRTNLSKTWNAIVSDFMTITRREQAVAPYLSEQQTWLVQEQIQLALAQAQHAVMMQNQTLFQTNIQQAIAKLVEYYDLNNEGVATFLTALQQLQSTPVSVQYPEVLQSQQSLSDILKSRVEQAFSNQGAL